MFTIGGPNTPLVAQSSFQQQRERLYRARAGRYVVVQDYDPQTPGDIPLSRGMPVEGREGHYFFAVAVNILYNDFYIA